MLKMNLWLVGLGLALLCTVNAESDECSGDHSKLQGKWYVTAIATDCERLLKHKNMMKIIVADVTIETDNKLLITSTVLREDGCKKIKLELDKLDDGTYVHTSAQGSTKKMEVMSTDCKTYGMVRAQTEHNGKTSNHVAMYNRAPKMSPEFKEKFLETITNLDFKSNQTIFPHEVACQDEE